MKSTQRVKKTSKPTGRTGLAASSTPLSLSVADALRLVNRGVGAVLRPEWAGGAVVDETGARAFTGQVGLWCPRARLPKSLQLGRGQEVVLPVARLLRIVEAFKHEASSVEVVVDVTKRRVVVGATTQGQFGATLATVAADGFPSMPSWPAPAVRRVLTGKTQRLWTTLTKAADHTSGARVSPALSGFCVVDGWGIATSGIVVVGGRFPIDHQGTVLIPGALVHLWGELGQPLVAVAWTETMVFGWTADGVVTYAPAGGVERYPVAETRRALELVTGAQDAVEWGVPAGEVATVLAQILACAGDVSLVPVQVSLERRVCRLALEGEFLGARAQVALPRSAGLGVQTFTVNGSLLADMLSWGGDRVQYIPTHQLVVVVAETGPWWQVVPCLASLGSPTDGGVHAGRV